MGRMKKAEHPLLSRCGSPHPNCKWGGGDLQLIWFQSSRLWCMLEQVEIPASSWGGGRGLGAESVCSQLSLS